MSQSMPMSNISHNPIGDRITEARDVAGITDAQLAVAADVSTRTIHTWRTVDAGRIPAFKLFGLAEALDVDPTWLLCGDHTEIPA